MSKLFGVFFASIVFWNYVDAENCKTPLGKISKCISLYDCPVLLTTFNQEPIPSDIANFLTQSQCGYKGNIPLVCCGPLPQERTKAKPKKVSTPQPTIFTGEKDGFFAEDSLPAPRHQCGIDISANSILDDDSSNVDKLSSGYGNQLCTTPSGRSSKCVSVDQCPDTSILDNEVSMSDNVIGYIKRSQCGFDSNGPKVCCESLSVNKVHKRSTAALTPTEIEDRIYSGDLTELAEFPWMALLIYISRSGVTTYQCGGSLINHRYVLTAAHCITGQYLHEYGKLKSARLGEYDTKKSIDCVGNTCADPPQEIPVDATYPHPEYKDTDEAKRHDIGIVRLRKRATYNHYVQPICLADITSRIHAGDELTVAGWGQTLVGGHSNIKLKLQLKIYNKDDCVRKFRSYGSIRNLIFELGENQLCAGGDFKKDACHGDSGGPLMKRTSQGVWEEVGLVSFGRGCGMDGWPAVYTSIVGYHDWIKNTIQTTNK